MDVERLRILADDLRNKPKDQFHLGFWFGRSHSTSPGYGEEFQPSCHTCGCIAGDALMLFEPDLTLTTDEVPFTAQDLLGLSSGQAGDLFTPTRPLGDHQDPWNIPPGRFYSDITPQEAAKVIDHLIETGDVDWRVIA